MVEVVVCTEEGGLETETELEELSGTDVDTTTRNRWETADSEHYIYCPVLVFIKSISSSFPFLFLKFHSSIEI